MINTSALAHALVDGSLDAGTFGHAEHVAAAYALLRDRPFEQAVQLYTQAIRALVAREGAGDKFHMTVTVAFLSLIAERLARGPTSSFEDFASQHPELMSPAYLGQLYSKARLDSDVARRTFVLPDRALT